MAMHFNYENIWLKLIERLEGTWVLIDNTVIADTRL